ncbi:hypothetical protein GCM10010298_51090 [Streptomyces microflavus]|uniref:Uncharacterized protein n=1 Tax=Streptomyces microflavus TaxID=1919 RepID=A0A7J0CKI7_STRMI|nr:hypothetical protein Smic_08310 [Streptomyces microflavus]GGX79495.1 hypothetical protein GCM10010298_51090 [Streptomyces microflavus]
MGGRLWQGCGHAAGVGHAGEDESGADGPGQPVHGRPDETGHKAGEGQGASGEADLAIHGRRRRGQPQPGHSPENRTDAWATVFTGANCEGESFTLRPHTGGASERLKVRSVVYN